MYGIIAFPNKLIIGPTAYIKRTKAIIAAKIKPTIRINLVAAVYSSGLRSQLRKSIAVWNSGSYFEFAPRPGNLV